MTTNDACQSCGMPMTTAEAHAPGHPDSEYCAHCANPDGTLQAFEERFERMVQWMVRQDGVDRVTAERQTRDHMRSQPAWRDHPALAG